MSFARLSQRLSGKTVVSANVFQEKLYISYILLCNRCFLHVCRRKENLLGLWDANPPRPHASALRYSLRGHKLCRAPNVWDAVLCRLWRQRALWSLEFGTLQLNPTQRPWQLQRVHSNWPQSAKHF